ncbi:DUF4286 family protein [Nocardioides sp. Root151]|uniref:DUF4286 family protein n=1 Tax=Nocardioides sp. Root151 TaxID=1736475 RepID=UPI0007027B1E|nr:DUF4286 family protein [Nocardioides sp. Root151]KQZ72194.1 hypothetical protein ASD66_23795 [Nocardioides sp. Root151]
MARSATMVVLINPVSEAVEAEFNRWYDEVHIPQVVERIPGVVGARRLRLTKEQLLPADALPVRRYMTEYDIDTDDLQGSANRLGEALGDGTLDMSEAVDMSPEAGPLIHYYEGVKA